jgi:hypothetical protein
VEEKSKRDSVVKQKRASKSDNQRELKRTTNRKYNLLFDSCSKHSLTAIFRR